MSSDSLLQYLYFSLGDGDGDDDAAPRPVFCAQSDIYLASRTGDLDRIRVLVEREGVDVNRRDFWDSVPLYYACLCGHLPVVKYLLSQGAISSENTFDGDRCLYGALTDEIREVLLAADVRKAPPLKPLATSIKKLCALCDDPEQPMGISQAFDSCCDLELTVGEMVYRANRAILASRLSRFDEILASQPISEGIHRISFSEEHFKQSVVEALIVYVYSEKVELEMCDAEQLWKLAEHYGNPALAKMIEKELHSIKYYFKSIRRTTAPKRFILYPYSFPEEASLEHDLQALYERSRGLDPWMESNGRPLNELCVRNDYADAVVEVEETRLRVHLCILCSRSDFFHRMALSSEHGFGAVPRMQCPLFGQSMAVLHVTDVRMQPVKYILEYIYSDGIISLMKSHLLDTELLSELFDLSDRFLILGAKRFLGERVKELEISFYQACQLLMLADFYNVANLRDFCLEQVAGKLDSLLSDGASSKDQTCFEAFVAELVPPDVTNPESLFDSSSTKGDFHGVLLGTNVSGIGSNTILEDLREKYLEMYGWKGEERDDHAKEFDNRFLDFCLQALEKNRS